jgi:hypothetical protein
MSARAGDLKVLIVLAEELSLRVLVLTEPMKLVPESFQR